MFLSKIPARKRSLIKFLIVLVLYLLFLYWVESWWGLIVVPFIYDAYITKFIKWNWWKNLKNPAARVLMSWVDAIVFALVAIYFLNQFFFQNFVIPSSSLEKTLLTGDYLLVSKLSYGPRIPQTPLTMPLTQNTMPITGGKSYLEWPQWEYRRVDGLGEVKLNDIVVFNYPSGDTVALSHPEQDYYGMAYSIGAATLMQSGLYEQLTPDMPYDRQQTEYAARYAVGTGIIKATPEEFGKVTSRPTDRRENYVKRCVGLPGQTLQIINDTIYLDGKPNPQPENVQYRYIVTFLMALDEDTKKELGITNEELTYLEGGVGFPMTEHVKSELIRRGFIAPNPRRYPLSQGDELYPLNMAKNWTTANYGPLWIPKKGETLKLTLETLPIYERPIRIYEGNTLEVRDGKIYINGQVADSYTFKMNYYWMMGDNRDNSADSRFWGFVPEDHVVGKPLFVWLSLDPDYSLFDGKIRWDRFFKWVANIK
ncbi:MAG: S26 family signal peptidase [Bacteroidales bacterium]|nr:S26 family signal peptidase [Bacteroidales bacterium]